MQDQVQDIGSWDQDSENTVLRCLETKVVTTTVKRLNDKQTSAGL